MTKRATYAATNTPQPAEQQQLSHQQREIAHMMVCRKNGCTRCAS